MSWSIHKIGLKEAVCKEVVECDHMPAGLKKTVLEVAAFSTVNGLEVSSSGHMGAGPCVYKFEVRPVALVLESPPRSQPVVPAPEPTPAMIATATVPAVEVPYDGKDFVPDAAPAYDGKDFVPDAEPSAPAADPNATETRVPLAVEVAAPSGV